MKIEEIKSWSDEELGRRLAEAVGYEVSMGDYWCFRFPKQRFRPAQLLCKDLNAIAETENLIFQKGLGGQFGGWLAMIVEEEYLERNENCGIGQIAHASARTRAEAAYLALCGSVKS